MQELKTEKDVLYAISSILQWKIVDFVGLVSEKEKLQECLEMYKDRICIPTLAPVKGNIFESIPVTPLEEYRLKFIRTQSGKIYWLYARPLSQDNKYFEASGFDFSKD